MSELAEIKVVQQRVEQVRKNFLTTKDFLTEKFSLSLSLFCRCFGLTSMFDRI